MVKGNFITIKIVSCFRETYWYSNHIGEEVRVKEFKDSRFSDSYALPIKEDEYVVRMIKKKDCIVL